MFLLRGVAGLREVTKSADLATTCFEAVASNCTITNATEVARPRRGMSTPSGSQDQILEHNPFSVRLISVSHRTC
jgi:hypothetical protein